MGTVIIAVACTLGGLLLGGLLATAGMAEERADCLRCYREKELLREQVRRGSLDTQLADASLQRVLEAVTAVTDKLARAGTLRIH